MLYYDLVYSRLQYGILVWGTANKTSLNTLKISQIKILRIMLSGNITLLYLSYIVYRTIDFLNLTFDNIYELELAKFMHRLQHQKLPKICTKSFTKLDAVHSQNTRQKQPSDYFVPRVNKKFSKNLLTFRGAKLWVGTVLKKNNFKTLSLFAFKNRIKKI